MRLKPEQLRFLRSSNTYIKPVNFYRCYRALISATFALLVLVPSQNLIAQQAKFQNVLLTDTQGHSMLELVENGTTSFLKITGVESESSYRVISLENPDRLVVDVDGLKVSNGKVQAVQGSTLVQQLRFGDHQTSGRVVIDLSEAVEYQSVVDQNGLVLSFFRLAGAKEQLVDSSDSFARAASKTNESDLEVVKAAKVQNAKEIEVLNVKDNALNSPADNTVASEVVAANTANTEVTKVALQNRGAGENIVLAQMSEPGIYTFERSAPSEYVLTIEQASVAEAVEPTLVAGSGSGAIRSVRTLQNGENVKLRIFTDPLKDLEANTQNGAIVISARKDILINPDKLMAQPELGELLNAEEATTTEDTNGEILAGEADLSSLLGSDQTYTGRLISLDLQDTEIDNALRIIAEVSNLNIIASDNVTGKVTLRLIDVPWDQALDVILKTNGLDKVQEGNVVRIAPVEKLRSEREALRQAQQAEDELEPLRVQYMRISYAKASDMQPLVETVLTERGAVTYDARTNQLIVKDIAKGVKNAARLVQKLDLRTPQVLIETQIVEAQRSFVRDLGSEFGFTFIRSPATGNALGYNFPNSVSIGGSAEDTRGDSASPVGPIAAFFPSTSPSSAVSALFSSADGTKSLNMRISAAEAEGRIRVVSRPSVAVTNNSPAVIKSVEKLRIRLPSGGVSVATGQGAAAGAGGSVATETIEVGIVLNVTAQASPDYYVLLDINAKSSSLGTLSQAVDDVPPEIERSTTSTVLVSSGQTFAMGGIYRVAEDSSIVGVPFLKDIPVLGSLFRRTGVNDRDEELIFFITPRIIEGSFDDAAMKSLS